MMLASPMMLAYANDVLLRKVTRKHHFNAVDTSLGACADITYFIKF